MGRYFVYILASRKQGTLYVGVTRDLIRRVHEHRSGVVPGFSKQYRVHRLVHFEEFGDVLNARQRERTLKHWSRDWKINLIERENPEWVDLYEGLTP